MDCCRASITCIVVSAPVIGRVSKVSFERALGTITGGLLGYVAYLVGTNVSQASTLQQKCHWSTCGLL